MMTNELKKDLFPYFAYNYSKKDNPAKYGANMTFDEWFSLIDEDESLVNVITEKALELSDYEWQKIREDYMSIPSDKKGGKLDHLKKLQKGKKLNVKKCSCGCDFTAVKEKGGKIVSKCACGCKN